METYKLLHFWLIILSIIILKFIHILVVSVYSHVLLSNILMYVCMYMFMFMRVCVCASARTHVYHDLFIHSHVDELWGYFQFWALTNEVATKFMYKTSYEHMLFPWET